MSKKNRDDQYLRRQKNRVQKWLNKESKVTEKLTSDWAFNLIKDGQSRLIGLSLSGTGHDKIKEFEADTQVLVLSHLEKYQQLIMNTRHKNSAQAVKIDRVTCDQHERVVHLDEKKLLAVFSKLKLYEVCVGPHRLDLEEIVGG